MSSKDKSPTTSTQTHNNNNSNKPPPAFSAADFAKWNQTTSVIQLPAKLVGKATIPQLRGELVKAIGEKKVAAVQALSPTKFRVEFRSSSHRHITDTNGITFRGVTLTPHPAYEEVKSVFVDRAPLQMPDQYLYDILAPYGRVLRVEHLKVKGFPNVRSGTRRVSMVINTHIPATIKISNVPISFRYRGQPPFCFVCQEVGHTAKECPRSRTARAGRNTRKADPSSDDLRCKLNHRKEDLRVKLVNNSEKVSLKTSSPLPPPPPSNATAVRDDIQQDMIVLDKAKFDHAMADQDNTNQANGQPEISSSSSLSSPAVRDAVRKLKEIFTPLPTETDDQAQCFERLAKQTKSAAAQNAVSSRFSGSEPSSTGFGVKLKGKPVVPKSKQQPAPVRDSFEFNLTPTRLSSSLQTKSSWATIYTQSLEARDDDDVDDVDYDTPLGLRAQKRRQCAMAETVKRRHVDAKEKIALPPSSATMEEDSVDECLDGDSVVDPIGPELPAVAAHTSPNDRGSVTQASTPASLISGAIELPSPISSQEIFNNLVAPAAPLSDSVESDFSLPLGSPSVDRVSVLAGQDRPSELLLDELPLLYLDPDV